MGNSFCIEFVSFSCGVDDGLPWEFGCGGVFQSYEGTFLNHFLRKGR